MMISEQLQAIFFDFDGVLVDSTELKTQAFYTLFKEYPLQAVEEVVAYHRQHGGVSRVLKIRYAFESILKLPLKEAHLRELAKRYEDLVIQQVISAPWISGARETLGTLTGKYPLFLISGTPQPELRHIIDNRNMSHYFREVLGSPTTKIEHLRRLLSEYSLEPQRCIFVGDAHTDMCAAETHTIPFIGIRSEYQFPDGITTLPDCRKLPELLEQIGGHSAIEK
ncbi:MULTISPECIES: HAD family hydrolase [Desulfosediminicola]|uniref:HAD family hydrolase n=1 Tax=Desulfosediminicola TaxID=2886823 RepID=UPI0010AD8B5E|nr:HAD family hydrolase [Desulfosediminicola ganghwensis]